MTSYEFVRRCICIGRACKGGEYGLCMLLYNKKNGDGHYCDDCFQETSFEEAKKYVSNTEYCLENALYIDPSGKMLIKYLDVGVAVE